MLAIHESEWSSREEQAKDKGEIFYYFTPMSLTISVLIAELAERSPIIIQNTNNPSSWKKLVVRLYDRTTVQGAPFNMRGQLYHGHANATALSSSPVVGALGSESDNLGSSPGQGKALCPWDMQGKKMWAPLLGLAKSIYYSRHC